MPVRPIGELRFPSCPASGVVRVYSSPMAHAGTQVAPSPDAGQETIAWSPDQAGAYFHECPIDPGCAFCVDRERTERANAWSFIDAAYCISLQEREDRARTVMTEMHRVGLCRKVRFYRPRRHDGHPWVGIWYSHRDVARHALAEGATNALILEDDVRFSRFVGPRRIRAVARAFRRLPTDWRVFYLGHWPLRARFVRRDTIATTSACTHAYVAGRPMLTWLSESTPQRVSLSHRWASVVGRGLDAAFAQLPGTYAYFPMLAVQSTSPSDHVRPKNRGRVRHLRHLLTRTRARDYLMSTLMRPNELLVFARSWARAAVESLALGQRHAE